MIWTSSRLSSTSRITGTLAAISVGPLGKEWETGGASVARKGAVMADPSTWVISSANPVANTETAAAGQWRGGKGGGDTRPPGGGTSPRAARGGGGEGRPPRARTRVRRG